MKKILVTGGLGYIGSHTVVELIQAGFAPVIVDNFSNSEPYNLDRINSITGYSPVFYNSNICSKKSLTGILERETECSAVIHFAAYKSVSESKIFPLKYFHNNLGSLLTLLDCMVESKIKNLVFSSSATVYGQPDELPVTEKSSFKEALSAYGSTKQMGEEILKKTAEAHALKCIALRYFNPVGAHASACIGELPRGVPTNLMPFITQTAIGKREKLIVFGNDYNSQDGTCSRDYVHVVDLAKAHVRACNRLLKNESNEPVEVFNIGTGCAYTVLEIIRAFESVTGQKLNYVIGDRREGDAECVYADTSLANQILGWRATLPLEDMVRSAWEWEKAINHIR